MLVKMLLVLLGASLGGLLMMVYIYWQLATDRIGVRPWPYKWGTKK